MSKPPPPPPGPVLNVTTADLTVTGTVNLETINALADHNTLIGGPGYEYLNAGSSNDTLEGAAGSDTFAGLTGSSNSTLIAFSDLKATLAGVAINLATGDIQAGLVFTGTTLAGFSPTHQYDFPLTAINLDNVTVHNDGDNILGASVSGSVLIVDGNGNNLLQGGPGNDALTVNGSGSNIFWDYGGTNTLTGGTGSNYYYEELGHAATKWTKAEYGNDTITNFNTSKDTLEFQMTTTNGNDVPTSWTLITVNGVASLHAVLGDGVSTLTLVGVTDPSQIHMEGVNIATGVVKQLPDVPLAAMVHAETFNASVALLGVSDTHPAHTFA